MGKYDSAFYNSERYYDPTVGQALRNIMRNEKRQRYVDAPAYIAPEPIYLFSIKLSKHYADTHPAKKNGKPPKFAVSSRIRKNIKLYEFCMKHCDDEDFAIEKVVTIFRLGSPKYVRQCFSKTGDIGKLINSWNAYKLTGEITWGQERVTE